MGNEETHADVEGGERAEVAFACVQRAVAEISGHLGHDSLHCPVHVWKRASILAVGSGSGWDVSVPSVRSCLTSDAYAAIVAR